MANSQNPFTINFGKTPQQLIPRLRQTNDIIESFTADKPSTQVFMITGIRGCGKTVMMTEISNTLRKDDDWIVVEVNPERDMLSSLAANLYAIPELNKLFIKAKLDLSALGMGVSIEGAPPVTDIENALDKMLMHIGKLGKRLLVTVDEVTRNPNVKVFAASFQIFIRKEYPLFLLMTGLYENLYDLQNEKSLTFLYRAPKVFLEPLNYTAMVASYMKIFGIDREEAGEMAACTRGYSYAFQVLGYIRWNAGDKKLEDLMPEYDQYLEEYVYSKIWSELSPVDKKIVLRIAGTRETKVTVLRESLGMTTPEFSVYRDRLKKKGLINIPQYGNISLALPRFEDFVITNSLYQ